jgi:shikimate kinase
MTIHLIRGLEGTGKTTLCKVLSERGYAAIDTDNYPGLAQWIHLDTGEPIAGIPDYVNETWIKSHRFIWRPERVRELLTLYEGRQAFLCGSAANVEEFYGVLGRRFYLWASDGTITRRLQERNPALWRQGSQELTRRLLSNQASRTKAILDGNVVLYAELPVEDVATDVMAYVVSADTAVG